MAEMKTRSARATAASVSGSTFRSTRETSKSSGSSAATVSRPRGGKTAFLPMKGRAYRMLQ